MHDITYLPQIFQIQFAVENHSNDIDQNSNKLDFKKVCFFYGQFKNFLQKKVTLQKEINKLNAKIMYLITKQQGFTLY